MDFLLNADKMRDTDRPETFQPLGSPIRPPAPTPAPKPSGTPGIVIDPDGKHRTVDHKPGQGLHARSAPVLGTGQSRTQHYNGITAGLMTLPVSIGARAVAWPEHEVDAIIRARIAGKSDDEIRALVRMPIVRPGRAPPTSWTRSARPPQRRGPRFSSAPCSRARPDTG